MNVSKVFDATKSDNYASYSNVKCTLPYTFLVSIGDFIMSPYDQFKHQCGFATINEAENFKEKFIKSFQISDYVALVNKNVDLTSGNGPMLPIKIFKNPDNAHHYIMASKGIYGSKQHHNIHFGVNINGELYCIISYNGYEIKLIKLE